MTLALTLLNISFGILVVFTSFSFWYFLSVFALGLTWLVLAFNASQKIQVVSKAVETIPEPPRNFKVLPNLSQLQYQYEVDPRREIIMDERPRPDMRKPSEVVLEERRRAKGA